MTAGVADRTPANSTRAPARFARAGGAGAALAFLLFAWMLTAGTFRPFAPQPLGNFYDAQAHALLSGHWDVDPKALGVEGFVIHGRSYTYFGPVPAVLRMPVALFTHRFDGRLTTSSMLIAFAVLAYFVVRLTWLVRNLVRGDGPLSRWEQWAVGGFVFALLASTPLYLASRAWVYHEALLWGLALALGANHALLRYASRGSPRALVAGSALATAAFLTRASIGAGPVAALALVAAIAVAGRIRARSGSGAGRAGENQIGDGRRWTWVTAATPLWLLLAAAVVPVLLYAAVNEVKFQSAFGLPMDKQVISRFDQNRKDTLAANGGNIFGPQFVPTALVQYLRPDALALDHLFPWISFPAGRATVVGHARFDYRDRSSSLPSTVPLLVVLAGVGLVSMARTARGARPARRRDGAGVLWVPLAGAVAGSATFLTIGFIANRYLTDALPLLVLPALVGLHHAVRRLAPSPPPAPPTWGVRLAALSALAGLAAFGVYANFALALWYQRDYSQNGSEDLRASFVGFQQSLDRSLPGGGSPAGVRSGTIGGTLPRAGSEGALYAVVEDGGARRCQGLYLSDGSKWLPVERTAVAGRFQLDLRVDRRPVGERDPLVSVGKEDQRLVLALEWRPGGQVALTRRAGGGPWVRGAPFSLASGPHRVNAVVDARVNQLDVDVDGVRVFSDLLPVPEATPFAVGAPGAVTAGGGASVDGLRPRFPGHLSLRPFTAPVCRSLLG